MKPGEALDYANDLRYKQRFRIHKWVHTCDCDILWLEIELYDLKANHTCISYTHTTWNIIDISPSYALDRRYMATYGPLIVLLVILICFLLWANPRVNGGSKWWMLGWFDMRRFPEMDQKIDGLEGKTPLKWDDLEVPPFQEPPPACWY